MRLWALLFLAVVFSQTGARPADSVPRVSETQPDNPNVKLIFAYPVPKENPNQLPKGNRQEEKYSKQDENDAFRSKGEVAKTENELQTSVLTEEGTSKDIDDIPPEEDAPKELPPVNFQERNMEEEEESLSETADQPKESPKDRDISDSMIQEGVRPLLHVEESIPEDTPAVAMIANEEEPIIVESSLPTFESGGLPPISEDFSDGDIDGDTNVDEEIYVLEDPTLEVVPGVAMSVMDPVEVVVVKGPVADTNPEETTAREEGEMGKTLSPPEEIEPVTVKAEIAEDSLKPMVSFPWSIDPIEPVAEVDGDTFLVSEDRVKSDITPPLQEASPVVEAGSLVTIPDVQEMSPAVETEPVFKEGKEERLSEMNENPTTEEVGTESPSMLGKISLQIAREENNDSDTQMEKEKLAQMAGFMADESKSSGKHEPAEETETVPSTTELNPVLEVVENTEDVTEWATELGEGPEDVIKSSSEPSTDDGNSEIATTVGNAVSESEATTPEPEPTVDPVELALQEEPLMEDDPALNDALF